MGTDGRLLGRAAESHGVELEYTDVFGHVHHASDEVVRALLEELGVPSMKKVAESPFGFPGCVVS
jgi:hypothetical protein